MPRHYWGDEDFDWEALNQAIRLGTKLMKRFGRIGVHSKEKYGTARWSLYLCNDTLHSFTHPGYIYCQYPKWLWNFDCTYHPLRFISPVIRVWQVFVIKMTFKYLCYKFPHIIDEIISDAPKNCLDKKLAKRAKRMWSTCCKKCDKWYTCDNESCPHCNTKDTK